MALVELSTAAPHIRILTLNGPETRNASEILLTGRRYDADDADDALRMGLVSSG